jgi:hypothetical protein
MQPGQLPSHARRHTFSAGAAHKEHQPCCAGATRHASLQEACCNLKCCTCAACLAVIRHRLVRIYLQTERMLLNLVGLDSLLFACDCIGMVQTCSIYRSSSSHALHGASYDAITTAAY